MTVVLVTLAPYSLADVWQPPDDAAITMTLLSTGGCCCPDQRIASGSGWRSPAHFCALSCVFRMERGVVLVWHGWTANIQQTRTIVFR